MDPMTGKPDSEDLLQVRAKVTREDFMVEEVDPETDLQSDLQSDLESYRERLHAIWVQRAKRAKELYNAGIPFYTKNAIRDLDQQLQHIRQKEPGLYDVTLSDLEGRPGILCAHVGGNNYDPNMDEDQDPGGVETFNLPPHISYHTLDEFTSPQRSRYFTDEEGLIQPLSIGTYLGKRDVKTKQIIHDDPLLPLEEVKTFFQKKRAGWEASEQGRNFLSLLESKPELPTVRKIIAFATSTLSTKPNTAAAVQLSLVLVVRDFFTKHQSDADPILCYAQEPWFTDIDKQVLKEHGIAVLDGADGFLEMDDDTVIISHNADVPVRSITADLARPAMMIWNKIVDDKPAPAEWVRKGWIDPLGCQYGDEDEADDGDQDEDEEDDREKDKPLRVIWADPVTPRVKKLARDYWEFDFPEGAFENFGPNPAIYIRKAEASSTLIEAAGA